MKRNNESDPQLALGLWSKTKARREHPKTSHEAARAAKPLIGQHHIKMLAALRSGPGNADEIADRAGLTTPQVHRRLDELVKAKLIAETGEVRLSKGRRNMRVFRLVPQEETP